MNIGKGIIFGSAIVGTAAWLCYSNYAMAKTNLPPLKPVSELDLKKYAGTWYEIAFVPYFFEKRGQRDAITNYIPTGPFTFQDSFQATLPDGKIKTFTGSLKSKAENKNGEANGEFRSTFVKLFRWQYWMGVDYLVTGLGKNYDFAIVSLPNRKLNWVFSRTPQLSSNQLKEVGDILKSQNINACRMFVIPQSNGLQEEQPFCNLLKLNGIN